jgi:putative DNA primase/helicase
MPKKVFKTTKQPPSRKKKALFKEKPKKRPKGGDSKPKLVVTRAADVKAEKVRWIWPGRISLGNVSFIFGDPGLGKSQIAVMLAATISNGRKWPCKEGSAPKGDVIMIIAEDGTADTVRPRLEAAGANLDRVHIIKDVDTTTGRRPFSLLADLDRLEEAIEDVRDPWLVIIDPASAFMTAIDGQQFNANDISQVRGLLGRVNVIAKRHSIGIIFISHPTKASGSSALYRLAGSSAFAAAARSVFMVTRGRADSKWRIFAPAKNNLGADSSALQYRIRTREVSNKIRAPYIVWNKDRLPITADDALANRSGGADKVAEKREIDEFLQSALGSGRRPARDMLSDGQQHGFSPKRLREAVKHLGGKIYNEGYGSGKKWWWELKSGAANPPAASEEDADEVADDDQTW